MKANDRGEIVKYFVAVRDTNWSVMDDGFRGEPSFSDLNKSQQTTYIMGNERKVAAHASFVITKQWWQTYFT